MDLVDGIWYYDVQKAAWAEVDDWG